MTIKKFIEDSNIKNFGKFISKISNKRFNKIIKLYKYIDINEFWFDYPDSTEPDWCDIEGIGYGWLWLDYKKSKREQRKALIRYAEGLYSFCTSEIFVCEEQGIRKYIFECSECGKNESIIIISLSQNELFW